MLFKCSIYQAFFYFHKNHIKTVTCNVSIHKLYHFQSIISYFLAASASASAFSYFEINSWTLSAGRILIWVLLFSLVRVASSIFSGVSLVMSKVFDNTLMERSSAPLRLVSSSLYSCFSIETAAFELFPMQVAFHPP